MTRNDLLIYLSTTLRGPAGHAQVANTDTPTGYQYVLDDVFRTLGVSEGDLATATVGDSLRSDAQLLGQYFAFNRFLDIQAPQQDMDGTQVRGSRTQPFTQFTDRLDVVRKQLIKLGYGDRLGLERSRMLRSYSTA